MACEAKRGCGFRQVGGLYLVCDGVGQPCDRLPFGLEVCPCCGQGIKPARGWTWIDPISLFEGDHDKNTECKCPAACPVCYPAEHFSIMQGEVFSRVAAGLLWIGEKFYPSPSDFVAEGAAQGISRRISALPRGFQVGETWVFLAHRKCVPAKLESALDAKDPWAPGIFLAVRPPRVERIVKESEYQHYTETIRRVWKEAASGSKYSDLVPEDDQAFWRLHRDAERGITLVPVPDNDPDHNPNGGTNDED